uniref:ATP-dependent DNA helicase n=1 Tax=Phytophthora ramorum TaxID=164328 RepID=H3G658_PHYRM
AVASSGIASLLLMGGRTAHSTFKIPLKIDGESTCNINKRSQVTELMRKASLIVWDEAPMAHRHAFEAVDRTLRDVLDNEAEPFGGKVVVLSGDFRQILPVVKGGSATETIDACLKSSELWPLFQKVRLTENMRVRTAATSDMEDDEDGNLFEQEVLNSLNISGIPPHKLKLKKGMPIIMMRNLNPDLGLCNGTRLRIVELKDHVIHATIMDGDRQGQHVLIPRI